ncbi:MAG: CPBP family intramembrane glutamic endopeptidase [Erysipelotrichaceae bacterium]
MGDRIFVFLFAIAVSILPEILVIQFDPSILSWVLPLKTIIVFILLILSQKKNRSVIDFGLVCFVLLLFQLFSDKIQTLIIWKELFSNDTFIDVIGASLFLKSFSVILVLAVLFIRLKDRRAFFLTKGNLDVYASEIKWLGIPANWVTWKKLALVSGILISLGTFMGTVFTVTGFNIPKNAGELLSFFPYIVWFALLNSLFEGIVYRNGILATLSRILPQEKAILAGALIFGVAHYFGAPGGIIGAIMASFLGWFMGRSVLETKGIAAAWLIHFMQDTVIFSALYLFTFL